jgi:hypothetical protein
MLKLDGHKDFKWFRPLERKTLRPLVLYCCVCELVQAGVELIWF